MATSRSLLTDRLGRVARDLRLSLTDRCNLRCTYCMPAHGLPWLPREDVLNDDEVVRLAGIFVAMGVEHIRLTGGEPLLRPGLVEIVRRLAQLRPRPQLALTTNGVGLAAVAGELFDAGLERVNVSLDTVDPAGFRELTRRPMVQEVIEGLAAAAAAGLTPVKVNAVLMRGVNDHGAADLLAWCLERGYELRFIEQMPLDAQHAWDASAMVTADEIHALLSTRFRLTPLPDASRGSAPAERFLVDGGPHAVGIIGSVTRPFCAACDRVRLTADGQIRNCLFARGESDLRGPLRAGASDAELSDLIARELLAKAPRHGIGLAGFAQPDRPMSAIGG